MARPPEPDRWRPTLGACQARTSAGTRFRVWAPGHSTVEVVLEAPAPTPLRRRLAPETDGTFSGTWTDVAAGARYRYRLDGHGPYPDPASRYQPDGVHGPSLVVDPSTFAWSDAGWMGLELQDLVVYELHVGTFSPEGTFGGVERRLPYLVELGITAIELMPVADFPGSRNWGYDGAALFAPARCYGTPDDLRRLIDAAHGAGLAVILDVVYNHLGPDGAYAPTFSPYFLSDTHQSPWGAGINLDGPHAGMVRGFFIENALHWLHEYHLDGLRLDATHVLVDDGPRHFLSELAARVRASCRDRPLAIIAEDHRNLDTLITTPERGGWGLDAVWADDFHHQIRRLTAGDAEAYYRDFSGSTQDLASTLRRGWFFTGQYSIHLRANRGTDPTGLPLKHFVICTQNHDQVGNRALGERLHHQIDLATYRAVTTLLLCAPETPLLFMGQEWAATTPFLYFTDHRPQLGQLVTDGRRREFGGFAAFASAGARARIPDSQAASTHLASRLRWEEPDREPHRSTLRLYRALLALRRSERALRCSDGSRFEVVAASEDALVFGRTPNGGTAVLGLIQLRGSGTVDLGLHPGLVPPGGGPWRVLLTTEDPLFAPDPLSPGVTLGGGTASVRFRRPGAVLIACGDQGHTGDPEARRGVSRDVGA